MRRSIGWAGIVVLTLLSQRIDGQRGASALPLHFSSGCQLDLNGDKQQDRALLIGSAGKLDLIVLLQNSDGYDGIVLSTRDNPVALSCVYGFTVRERGSNGTRGRTFRTPGTYLELA